MGGQRDSIIYFCCFASFGGLNACRLLKIREEADPFSMDIGVLRKGDIVKVLEVSGLAVFFVTEKMTPL